MTVSSILMLLSNLFLRSTNFGAIIHNGLLPPSCAVFVHLWTSIINPSRPLNSVRTGRLVPAIRLCTRTISPLRMVSTLFCVWVIHLNSVTFSDCPEYCSFCERSILCVLCHVSIICHSRTCLCYLCDRPELCNICWLS